MSKSFLSLHLFTTTCRSFKLNVHVATMYMYYRLHCYPIVPGVMQLESKRSSFGKTCPFSRAFLMLSSASRADLKKCRKYMIVFNFSTNSENVIQYQLLNLNDNNNHNPQLDRSG